MARLTRSDAVEILDRCHARRGDFHALNTDAVAALVAEANAYGYRAPRNANGSRGRYWHAYLTRVANQERG